MSLPAPRALVRPFLACVLGAAAGVAAETEPAFVLPQLPEPLTGHARDGTPIDELEVFRTPVASLAQESEAFAAAQAGLEQALDEADPAAAIDYLAAYFAVRRSAERLAAQTPGASLPTRDLFRPLLEARADEAWREDRPGTALLAWMLRDRVSQPPGQGGRSLVERSLDANEGWMLWRRRVLAELPRILPPVTGLGTLGYTIPPWSPLLRHPHDVLGNDPTPFADVAEIAHRRSPARDAYRAAGPGATLRIKAAAPRAVAAPRHSAFLERTYVPIQSDAFTAFERTQKENLAELDRRIAAAQARADREAPKITKTERTRTLVGYEDRPMFERALPFGAKPPGVRQGDLYRSGTIRVPIYEERTITREVVDPSHPLHRTVQALRQERLAVVQQEFPAALRDSVAVNERLLDQWIGTADVPLEVDDGTGPMRLVLRVPFVRIEARRREARAPDLVEGEALWRGRAQDVGLDGAADVHRAVALWWNLRQLQPRLGDERAAREVALLGELGFGLRPDTGPVVSRLREAFRLSSNAASALYEEDWPTGAAPAARADAGAPVMASAWPGFSEKATPAPAPGGEFRLVHDPAVAREAGALAARLRAAGLSVTLEARPLPRTAPLFPVLAFARSRSADLGAFLWRTVPEQMPALHDPPVAQRELRLHAPADERRFAEGLAWILAHPSRFAEARRLARRLRALGGPQTYVDISVSVRGVVREGHPEKTVLAPDASSRWLRDFLRSEGLADYLPTEDLRLGPLQSAPPDLVVVLRGQPGAPARGLPPAVLEKIGDDPDKLLLVTNGSGRLIQAAEVAATSLGLW